MSEEELYDLLDWGEGVSPPSIQVWWQVELLQCYMESEGEENRWSRSSKKGEEDRGEVITASCLHTLLL